MSPLDLTPLPLLLQWSSSLALQCLRDGKDKKNKGLVSLKYPCSAEEAVNNTEVNALVSVQVRWYFNDLHGDKLFAQL